MKTFVAEIYYLTTHLHIFQLDWWMRTPK